MDNSSFNFDAPVSRRGTNCYKWDETEDGVLPLWVADMDFPTAPCIVEALRSRVEHGVFGYTLVPGAYYQAVVSWFQRRHGWKMKAGWILYLPGVVPAVSAIIKAMTRPGDKVLVQTPVYNCFFSSIRNNGCLVEENELVFDGGTYTIDFDDFERRVADPLVKVFLLCNPHNPAGRVWSAQELRRMGELCLRHGVFVISDEIHCELVSPGYKYTPYGSLSQELMDNCAVCTSPSKAFNTAGLQIANITISNAQTRKAVDKAININEVCDVNPFGVVALQAAYNQGEPWLQALNAYIWQNYRFLCGFARQHLPMLTVCKLEGTYLAWLKLAGYPAADEVAGILERDFKLKLSSGQIYGREAGRNFLRLNLACPRTTLQEALQRLKKGLESMK